MSCMSRHTTTVYSLVVGRRFGEDVEIAKEWNGRRTGRKIRLALSDVFERICKISCASDGCKSGNDGERR